jgi:hypothetical protein
MSEKSKIVSPQREGGRGLPPGEKPAVKGGKFQSPARDSQSGAELNSHKN